MSHGTQNYWSSWASHIWYHVCFVFPVCTGFKKTVAGEEEMNVLKSIKYLYTAVLTWFTWSVASFGNTCNHQEENTILCWNITYNRKMLLLHISLPFYKFSQRLIFHCAWMTDKQCGKLLLTCLFQLYLLPYGVMECEVSLFAETKAFFGHVYTRINLYWRIWNN